jgi:hypothetical protein
MPSESFSERVRAAWDCGECRRHRHATLLFAALFLLAWMLL